MSLQFKIQLKNIQKPPVWRRVLVNDNITFHEFHLVIQAVFGWANYHLYQFAPGGWGSRPIIKLDDPEDDYYPDYGPNNLKDSTKVKLADIFNYAGQKYNYKYDFGDDWDHQVMLEEITEGSVIRAVCLAGKGFCPPEDCGGPWGYARLLEVLNGPKDQEYKETRAWLGLKRGQQWDVNAFDVKAVNENLKLIEADKNN